MPNIGYFYAKRSPIGPGRNAANILSRYAPFGGHWSHRIILLSYVHTFQNQPCNVKQRNGALLHKHAPICFQRTKFVANGLYGNRCVLLWITQLNDARANCGNVLSRTYNNFLNIIHGDIKRATCNSHPPLYDRGLLRLKNAKNKAHKLLMRINNSYNDANFRRLRREYEYLHNTLSGLLKIT